MKKVMDNLLKLIARLQVQVDANEKKTDIEKSFADIEKLIASIDHSYNKIEQDEQRLELVIESTGVGIWDWWIKSGETIFNERWANIIGYTLDEISPVNIDTWIKYAHPDDLPESERLLKEHWQGKTQYYIFESRMKHKNGHWIWVYDTGQVVEWAQDKQPLRMIGTHLDISEQKENQRMLAAQKRLLLKQAEALDLSNKTLKSLCETDPLTQIPNRRAYEQYLTTQINAAKRTGSALALLMIDIDYFKQYNDGYGHLKGDQALIKVAKAMQQTLTRATDFVARFGGEEFVVLLPCTLQEGAVKVAQNMLNIILAQNIDHGYSKISNVLTISIGIAVLQGDLLTVEKLLHNADRALYHAKSNGRNCISTRY
ncbi:MAG: diguanylate cyclase (GGDEF)-like protein/PAS domain S-box-containing protein [Psychromonas sp.]|jgi:diguanylate cyclase (GGDEF)-like protein/PAS domain S-box-containing protein|uniref:sensor domain-containing diguanylate cyclase n=1 Tax=Psychromonas sp. TaxID=1884585 RepID=UPI0039E5EF15